MPRLARRLLIPLAVATATSACGADVEATGYSAETRDAFLTACTRPGDDPRMVRDVCECTYDLIEANVAFADFVAIEESLQVDGLAPVPDLIAGFVAECFVEEVEL